MRYKFDNAMFIMDIATFIVGARALLAWTLSAI